MTGTTLGITYVGGPTALLELAGARLLTDPEPHPFKNRKNEHREV